MLESSGHGPFVDELRREAYIQGRTDSSMNRLRDELRLQAMAAEVLQGVFGEGFTFDRVEGGRVVYREGEPDLVDSRVGLIEPRGGTA